MNKVNVEEEILPVEEVGSRATRRHVTVAVAVYCSHDDWLDESPDLIPLEHTMMSTSRTQSQQYKRYFYYNKI